MKRFTDFIKNWGGFIALCLIDVALIALFIISECRSESELLRIITGIVTLPIAGIGIVAAIFTAIDAKGHEQS